MKKRKARALALGVAALSVVCLWSCCRLGGDFRGEPEELNAKLSPAARALVSKAFKEIPGPVEDYHAHITGLGTDGTGTWINPSLLSWWHPFKHLKTNILISASGVRDLEHFDRAYADRLLRLARGFGHPARVHILAMDYARTRDGAIDESHTDFHVPNATVVALAEAHPDVFVPVISVHPARPDALAELDAWAAHGVRFVKWLPNAQLIDPSDPCFDPFYRKMREHGMILLTHTGDEEAVHSPDGQALGNPLLLRRPLDLGVKVIMAHCACAGEGNFARFLEMMGEARYRTLLFADISAMTQVNRAPGPLLEILRRPELHERLVNGTDYPLPAVNCLVWTRQFVRAGMITAEEREGLNEIYGYNPLLFDLVLKRTIKDPVSGKGLPAGIFVANPGLGG